MRSAAAACILLATVAAARSETVTVYDSVDPVPESVAAQVTCDRIDTRADVVPFAGGVLFKMRCPGNNANYVQGFVFAQDKAGAGARALLFPGPGPKGRREPMDSLSNSRLTADRAEITELSVDPEVAICRTEGRWRLEGASRKPRLVFWRETRDCEGKNGWRVRVGVRKN